MTPAGVVATLRSGKGQDIGHRRFLRAVHIDVLVLDQPLRSPPAEESRSLLGAGLLAVEVSLRLLEARNA